MDRGVYFSIDALVSFLFLLFTVWLVFSASESNLRLAANSHSESGKIISALIASDLLVKNRNSETPVLGSAYYASEKKRAVPNLIDKDLLFSAQPVTFQGYVVGALYLRENKPGSEPKYVFNHAGYANCFVVERLVVLKSDFAEKSVLGVALCG